MSIEALEVVVYRGEDHNMEKTPRVRVVLGALRAAVGGVVRVLGVRAHAGTLYPPGVCVHT